MVIRGRDIIRFGKQIGFYCHKLKKYQEVIQNFQANTRKKSRDVYFDKVKEIKYVGVRETWDLEVEGKHRSLVNHTYCVNDILTHNSSFASQESDTVLMVYRTKEEAEAIVSVEFSRRTGAMDKKVRVKKIKGKLAEITSNDEMDS